MDPALIATLLRLGAVAEVEVTRKANKLHKATVTVAGHRVGFARLKDSANTKYYLGGFTAQWLWKSPTPKLRYSSRITSYYRFTATGPGERVYDATEVLTKLLDAAGY